MEKIRLAKMIVALLACNFLAVVSSAQVGSNERMVFRCSEIKTVPTKIPGTDQTFQDIKYTGFYFQFSAVENPGDGILSTFNITGDLEIFQDRTSLGRIEKSAIKLEENLTDRVPDPDAETEDDRSSYGTQINLNVADKSGKQFARFDGNTESLRSDFAYSTAHVEYLHEGKIVSKDFQAECGYGPIDEMP